MSIINLELTEADTVLPCPFCGSSEVDLQNTHRASYWIECVNCGATAPGKTFGKNQPSHALTMGQHRGAANSAIKAWNTRAALSQVHPLVTVRRRDWMTADRPELWLVLSNGNTLKVQWSIEYACRLLFLALPDGEFEACTAEATGLHPDEVEALVDEVYRAVMADEAERLADQWDDGRES